MKIPVVGFLAAIMIVVFILQNIFPITNSFSLISDDILVRPWILVTSIFFACRSKTYRI